MLQSLLEIAQKDDATSRVELVDQLVGLFLDGVVEPSHNEEELFAEVLSMLLTTLGQDQQIKISNRFAHSDKTPRQVALSFAYSELALAQPVLSRAQVLTNTDLMQIASDQGEGHLLAIATREELSVDVTDVIIKRDMQGPILATLRNIGANFSQSGFDTILTKAEEGAREISHAMSYREDIPATLSDRLMEVLPHSARMRFQALMSSNGVEAAEFVRIAASTVETNTRFRKAELAESSKLVNQIGLGRRDIQSTIIRLAEEGKVDSICHVLASAASLSSRYVHNVIHKDEITAFVVLCRAIDCKSYETQKAVRDYSLIDKSLAIDTLDKLKQVEAPSE